MIKYRKQAGLYMTATHGGWDKACPIDSNVIFGKMNMAANKGFTLIELMIVIAIIGILAAIAVPSMIAYKKKAHYAVVLSECKVVYNDFMNYYSDNNQFPKAIANPAFQLDTFSPLNYQGSIFSRLVNNRADAFDSPDDQGVNQEFWVRMTLAKNPSVQFVIASSDNCDLEPGVLSQNKP